MSAPGKPLEPTNSSSLSISRALSSTPTESPALSLSPDASPDLNNSQQEEASDDALRAAAAQRGQRRSSLQAPGLIQLGGESAFSPTVSAIPGSTEASPDPDPEAAGLGAGGGGRKGEEQIGKGETVVVEFLLVSGKRMRRSIGLEATVREVREELWRRWPEDWRSQDELPPSADSLRLLYLGKFLDDKQTLASYGLNPTPSSTDSGNETKEPTPPATIIHLNIRPLATEGEYNTEDLKPSKSSACGCCVIS